jgi:hypothetical protein
MGGEMAHCMHNVRLAVTKHEIQNTRLFFTRPQVPCVTQKGSKELDLRKWLEIWCRSQLPTLRGVEGLC